MGIKLQLPFTKHFPITFGFGEIPHGMEIKQKFSEWGLAGHHGIDFGLPEGTEVLSCDNGKVIMAQENGDFGICVIMQHLWGQSWYAHLQKTKVNIKDEINTGQIIGISGKTGAAFGPHLHFGIKLNNADPNNGYLGFSDPSPYFSEDINGKMKIQHEKK